MLIQLMKKQLMHDSAVQVMKKRAGNHLFYNENKVGVDCFDQMARLYTTRSASRRWPLAVWVNIFDIVAINSYVLYKKLISNRITRRQFILMLVENLRGKPEPCLSNNNRQLRGNNERSAEAEEMLWCMLRQQDSLNLYFMSKTYLWKMFTRQFILLCAIIAIQQTSSS